jgi:hypothetical protein
MARSHARSAPPRPPGWLFRPLGAMVKVTVVLWWHEHESGIGRQCSMFNVPRAIDSTSLPAKTNASNFIVPFLPAKKCVDLIVPTLPAMMLCGRCEMLHQAHGS